MIPQGVLGFQYEGEERTGEMTALAIPILGESLHIHQGVGIALIFSGIYLATGSGAAPAPGTGKRRLPQRPPSALFQPGPVFF